VPLLAVPVPAVPLPAESERALPGLGCLGPFAPGPPGAAQADGAANASDAAAMNAAAAVNLHIPDARVPPAIMALIFPRRG
jgi:hypothetical protein